MIKPKLFYKFSHKTSQSALPLDFLNQPAVFETMRSYAGRILGLRAHLERLSESSQALGFKLAWSASEIATWLRARHRQSRTPQALLRLMVVRAGRKQALILMHRAFSKTPASVYRNGVQVTFARTTRNLERAHNPQIKANLYLEALHAFLQGAGEYYETFFINTDGYLTEGSISNLMLVKDKRLFTPSAACGILRGVTRQLVLKAAAKLGLPFHEVPVTRHDLYNADEAFLTTTLREVVPVVRCNDYVIGKGRPGPITKQIHSSFQGVIKELSHEAYSNRAY